MARNGAIYIGNIVALQAWYDAVRRPLLARTPHGAACLAGALRQLAAVRAERLKRLDELVAKIAAEDRSALGEGLRAEHEALVAGWPAARERLGTAGDVECAEKTAFLAAWSAAKEESHVARVQGLSADARAAGTAWLNRIVAGAGSPG